MNHMASKQFALKTDATIVADGNTDAVRVIGATKVSMFGTATLAGTTPSFAARVQTKDANGNWHNLGTGVTKTSSGAIAETGLTGPFGEEFRINMDIDVADANETYTGVDLALVFEYE